MGLGLRMDLSKLVGSGLLGSGRVALEPGWIRYPRCSLMAQTKKQVMARQEQVLQPVSPSVLVRHC